MKTTIHNFKVLISNIEKLCSGLNEQAEHQLMRDYLEQILDVTKTDIDILLHGINDHIRQYNTNFREIIRALDRHLINVKDSVTLLITTVSLHSYGPQYNITEVQYKHTHDLMEDSKSKINLLKSYLEGVALDEWLNIFSYSLFRHPNDQGFCLEMIHQKLNAFHNNYLVSVEYLQVNNPFSVKCGNMCATTDGIDPDFDWLGFWLFSNMVLINTTYYAELIDSISTCLNELDDFLHHSHAILTAESTLEKPAATTINVTTLSFAKLKMSQLQNAYSSGAYSKSLVSRLFSEETSVFLTNEMDSLRSEIKNVLTAPLLKSADAITEYVTQMYCTGILATWVLSTYLKEGDRDTVLTPIWSMNIWRKPLPTGAYGLTYERETGDVSVPEDVEYFVKNDMFSSVSSLVNRHVVKMKRIITHNDDLLRQLTSEIERDISEIERELSLIVVDTDFTQSQRSVSSLIAKFVF